MPGNVYGSHAAGTYIKHDMFCWKADGHAGAVDVTFTSRAQKHLAVLACYANIKQNFSGPGSIWLTIETHYNILTQDSVAMTLLLMLCQSSAERLSSNEHS